jgi:bifunctional DNA-binding transcriptional regulator/antitoxin component of YhaV-PrlF toxin-antitoxin module
MVESSWKKNGISSRRADAMSQETIQLREKGVLTLPVNLRRKYSLSAGDVFSLIDLGEGAFVLSPNSSKLAALGDKVSELLQEQGVSVNDMLLVLEEEREQYYREHYVDG